MFETSPFAPADFEVFSTIESADFEAQSSFFIEQTASRRSKSLIHALGQCLCQRLKEISNITISLNENEIGYTYSLKGMKIH